MRQPILLAVLTLPLLCASAFADCRDDILSAMARAVTSGPYRVETVITMSGVVSESAVDIVPGEAMHASSKGAGMRHETVVIGERAWMNTDGTWQVMPPELAAGAVAALKSAAEVGAMADFTGEVCSGPSSVEGREVLTYAFDLRTDGSISHNEVQVDAATGLPIRLEAQTDGAGFASSSVGLYTYDKSIVIKPPA
jgi:hypothetical protein